MPLYLFEHIETGEIKEIFFAMKEDKVFNGPDGEEPGKWRRSYTTSQLATAGLRPIDPFSSKQFVDKTGAMKGGTIGALWDYSKEQSDKRAAKEGTDKVKERYYRQYQKSRKGTPHMKQLAEKQAAATKAANEKMAKAGISISLA